MNSHDQDLGSTAPALLSNGTVLQVGKNQLAYLMSQSNLGGNTGTGIATRRSRCARGHRRRWRCRRRKRGLRAVRRRAPGRADERVPAIGLRALDERQCPWPAHQRRRADLVDRWELALRHRSRRPAPRSSSSPSGARPTTSRRRRSATACSSPRPAIRSSPSPARPAFRGRRPAAAGPAEFVVLARRIGRRDLHVRQRRLLRLDRRHPPEPAGRRHGADGIQGGLLAGGVRRRDLQLRRRRLPRIDGRQTAEQADRRHGGDARRRRLLAGRVRRRHLQLRRRRLLRLDGRQATEQAHRRHGRDP